MNAYNIPLQAVPSQTMDVTLGSQDCTLRLYAKEIYIPTTDAYPPAYEQIQALFLDVLVLDSLIVGGVLCRNEVGILQDAYFGFAGELAFYDTSGASEDPVYQGLGSRWQLLYWS